MDPSTDEARRRALRCLSEERFAEAESILAQLVDESPHELAFHEGLIETLFRQGKTTRLIEQFAQMLDRFKPTEDTAYHAIYLRALSATTSSPLPLRRLLRFYELIQQFGSTLDVEGDVAECGCFRGMSSYLICSYLRNRDHRFAGQGYHIFDSFEGLPEPTGNDEIPLEHPEARRLEQMTWAGAFRETLNKVQQNLAEFPEIAYHPGWIPRSFEGVPERRYRFVHIDVDLHDPTSCSLEYFFPRLAAGGKIVSDDYGWPGARKAIDDFCAERNIKPLITFYQQAVIVSA